MAMDAEGVQIEVRLKRWTSRSWRRLWPICTPVWPPCSCRAKSISFIRRARAAVIAYLVVLQLFLLYMRIQAKLNNDRTPIELKNPLSSILQSQLGGDSSGREGGGIGGGNNMMKNLASSFLSSKSTVLEYDLKQARSMQSGLIFNMLFMWFLHFKMAQVQPLLISTLNGLTTMVYSPLFQVYVLGRNLARPFQNPALNRMQGAATMAAVTPEAALPDKPAVADDDEEQEEEDDAENEGDRDDESEVDESGGENDLEDDDDETVESAADATASESEEKVKDETTVDDADSDETTGNVQDKALNTPDTAVGNADDEDAVVKAEVDDDGKPIL